MYGGGSDSGDQIRQQQQAQQAQIAQGVQDVNKTFSGFTPGFYAGRAGAYEKYALPQVQDQYQKALGNTTYSLARAGLLKSGAADYLDTSLNREMTKQLQGVANTGIGQAQQLESNVNQQKNQIVAQLQASADPSTAAQQATAAASQFSAPSTFAPLGQLFGSWQNMYLTNQLANAYAPVVNQPTQQASGYGAPTQYTTPGFGAPLGSSSFSTR